MPNTWTKAGVRGNLHPIMMKTRGRLERLYHSKGLDFFITSIGEGNHGPGSFHLFEDGSLALDFKRHKLITNAEIMKACGPDHDIIEYNYPRYIYHVEYDVWK